MLLDGLQLVRFRGSLFEGVVLSSRGISGEEAGQVGAWRGFVRVSCAGRAPGLARALSARGVSRRRLLRDAAIVLVGGGLSQACAENNKGHHTQACKQHNGPCLSRGGRGGWRPCLRQNAALKSDFWIKHAAMPPFHLRALHSGSEWIFRALLLIHKSQNTSTPEHISHAAVIYNPDGAEINPEFRLNMVKTAFCCT